MQRIRIIDSHTGGEPTRLVIGGFPDLGQGDTVLGAIAEAH
ncbi:proline racemase family protein, partial [Pseudomonas sp. L01]|nr:proline racemase family protein [Pseudomonas sp. L01]